MSIKGNELLFAVLCAGLVLLISIFLWQIGIDALNEENSFQFFADSNTYRKAYLGQLDGFDGQYVGVSANFLGPLAVLALFLGNDYMVAVFNVFVFFVSLVCLSRVCRLSLVRISFLLFLSPLTLSTLMSVNKEIFFFPILLLVFFGIFRRSQFFIFAAFFLSFFVRWHLSLFCLGVLPLVYFRGVKGIYIYLFFVVVACSIGYVAMADFIEPVIKYSQVSIENYDADGSGLFELTLDFQGKGFYWLVFPVKAAHLLFGMGLNFGKMLNPTNLYNDFFVSFHCLSNIFLLILMCIFRPSLRCVYFILSVLYLSIFCLTPVFNSRYLYPVYVFWTLSILRARQISRCARFEKRFVGQ